MDIVLKSGRSSVSKIEAISSKSYVHRLLIASALCNGKCSVATNIISKDMEATVRVLRSLGLPARIEGSDYGCDIKLGNIADCGESGSTARLILPLATLISGNVTFTGSGKLPERPMGPLCEVLRDMHVSVSSDHLPITIKGIPRAGDYEIAGNVSSQFISGLLFLLPFLHGDSNLTVTEPFESAAYVDMTLDVLARFNVSIKRTPEGFHVRGGQEFRTNAKIIKAEGDWSNGAYIMAIGALGCGRMFDSLTVTGLNPSSIQGDRAIVDIFEKFGIEMEAVSDNPRSASYVIKSGPKKPVDIDCSQTPDLVPALAAIAAFANGKSIFRNVSRLRMKESDRVEAIRSMLAAVNVEVDITNDDGVETMIVCGTGAGGRRDATKRVPQERSDEDCLSEYPTLKMWDAIVASDWRPAGQDPRLIRISSCNDHRIAMAAAAIAAAIDEPVVIEDAMAVDKSYPGFYEAIKPLGINSKHAG